MYPSRGNIIKYTAVANIVVLVVKSLTCSSSANNTKLETAHGAENKTIPITI
jgi:hypothetical protein